MNQPSTYENGQKGAIVEFFGWPYDDITQECELNPWWFVYQPVSYRLHSRMGTKQPFKNIILQAVRVCFGDLKRVHPVRRDGPQDGNMRTTHSHQSALEWSSPQCINGRKRRKNRR